MNQEACQSLLEEDDSKDCTPGCRCKEGYARNANNICVKQEECECYNGTVPVPVNIRVYSNNGCTVEYCNDQWQIVKYTNQSCVCEDEGEWEEWSTCSSTCGGGKRIRTRTEKQGCQNSTLIETEDCGTDPCPCIIDGREMSPDEIIDEECRYCKCVDSVLVCQAKNITEPWDPDCDHTCYCAQEDGTKVCLNKTRNCAHIEAECNNATHYTEEDPDDKCCVVCKPRCQKTLIEWRRLNFTDTSRPGGYCESEPIDVNMCQGSCGPSESGGATFEWRKPGEPLPMFDLDYYSNCKCCLATLEARQVKFFCGPPEQAEAEKQQVMISVTNIASCACDQCA